MLIVGLGNPGQRYSNTRHNAGFIITDALLDYCRKHNALIDEIPASKFKGKAYQIHLGEKYGSNFRFYILQPQTFMNLSGESVQPFMAWHNIPVDNLLVIHDELDLSFSDIRLKTGGGLAGHHGLQSIYERLSSSDFHRLRIGIGREGYKEQMPNFVLSPFAVDERDKVPTICEEAFDKIDIFLRKKPQQKLK